MMKIARRYAPFLFAAMQSAVTTAVATGIATAQLAGPAGLVSLQWGQSWLLSWIAMLPIVIGMAPGLQRLVGIMTHVPRDDVQQAHERRRDSL